MFFFLFCCVNVTLVTFNVDIFFTNSTFGQGSLISSIFLLFSTTLKHFACLNWVSFHSVPSLTYFFIVCNLAAYKYLHLNSWVLVSLASLALYQKLCNGCSLSLAHISIICIRSSILRNWSVPSMHISILNALGKFV